MSNKNVALVTVTALLGAASPAGALEKTTARLQDGRDWSSPSSGQVVPCVSLSYFNICTGWVWIWDGWEPNDRIGVVYENVGQCSGGSTWKDPTPQHVQWSTLRFWAASPAGYGFTGTLSVYAAEDGCLAGSPIQSQPFLPASGLNVTSWNAFVPEDFVVMYTLGPGEGNPVRLVTDHPAQGPTGPQACGTCFPPSRGTHSFYFGSSLSPLCPGRPFDDGVCTAELHWTMDGALGPIIDTTSLRSASWGAIKALYR
jgi:hypothetical protein